MNPWVQLRRMIPKEPLLVGTVTAHRPGGTSMVDLIGGGSAVVRGQGVAVGQTAYVKAGQIVGDAPSLATVTIEI